MSDIHLGILKLVFKLYLKFPITETSVYTKHGTLRGCAKLRGNFGDNQNCTSTDRVGYKRINNL